MNKKQITAVKKTVIMWSWLRDHPTKDKWDYFEAHKIGIQEIPMSECYLCEFVNCTDHDCPLYSRKTDIGCIDGRQPYILWVSAYHRKNLKATSLHAQHLINQCNKWLKKHEKP